MFCEYDTDACSDIDASTGYGECAPSNQYGSCYSGSDCASGTSDMRLSLWKGLLMMYHSFHFDRFAVRSAVDVESFGGLLP